MKVSRILILLLIALLYWTFYYLFSWKFIPHIESWLLSRYIPLKESERFQPFLTRSPNNLFDFTAFNDPMASRVSSPITNLSLVMIQPSDYVELHNNGREEDDLVLSQNDSIIFDIRGPGLQSPISPPPSSSVIGCLRVTAQLRHSTDFVSEVRELFFQLPMREDTDKIHVDLKISESFQLPAKCQTYRVHVSSETGFCYEQPRNTSYPIRFESTDPTSTLYLSRLFYLLFLPDTHMVTKVLADEDSTSHSEISPLTPSSKTDTSDAVPIPSTTPPPQKPPATSSQGSSKKKEETATMKMAESVLLLPKAVAIVAPANDAILKGMTSMNVTFAIPVTFYTLSDVMSLVLQVNDQQFDVTQSLLQIVPPSDMLERDIDNWQQHMQLLSPHTRAGADITSLKRFMQKSLISEESNSRYFLLRYLYLVWISLQEIPRGSYQLSLKAFVRTPSDEGSRSNEIELLGFDAIRFQAQ